MKTLKKESIIEIKNTFKRFISIALISFLGVGFFCGIRVTSPDMKLTVDKYFDDTNSMDIQVISTLGLTSEDGESLKELYGVKEVILSHSIDKVVKIEEQEKVVKIHTINNINTTTIIDGRMPKNETECVVEAGFFLSHGNYKIGDKILIEDDEFLKNTEMKIVGTVKTPLYISATRGNTKLGSGTVDFYMYVPQENIKEEIFTECYVILEGTKEKISISDEYEDLVENIKNKIETLSEKRKKIRYEEVLEEANKKVIDAENTLNEEKEKAYKEIEDATHKINDAKNLLKKSKRELVDGEETANKEFSLADEKIASAENEINKNEQELIKGEKEIEKNFGSIDNGEITLKSNKQTIESAIKTINENITVVEENKTTIESNILSLEQMTETPDIISQLDTLRNNLMILNTNLTSLNTQLNNVTNNLNTIDTTLQSIQNIKKGKLEISSAKQEIETNRQELENKKQETEKEFSNGWLKIQNGEKEIEENEKKLEDAKKEADEKFLEAEKKIEDAKEEIAEIEEPKWYILTRNENMGYAEFKQDTERIAKIGILFPAVFFIVAVLIGLTSMTRMVEEQRDKIGILKALGYNKFQIAMKYVAYAFFATVIGSFLGMAVGFNFLPRIIFMVYSMMYTMIPVVCEFNITLAVWGLGLIVICICGATILATAKELMQFPAVLMRPKAPKAGKRVILEKIPFIWKKLKFTQKVTIRNIFRYKKRVLMTIIGILGCTSLIVAGFGLRDSISSMIPAQYENVFKYTMQTSIKDKKTEEDIDKLLEEYKQKEEIESSMKTYYSASTVKNGELEENIQLIVPEDNDRIKEFINLQSRTNNQKYFLNNSGVILTEKLANIIQCKEGDIIKIIDSDDKEVETKVTGITENYIMHFAYMSQDLYEQLYKEKVKYNVILSKTTFVSENVENEFAKQMLKQNSIVSGVTFTRAVKGVYDDVMESMTFVVWILIISAGLLAFTVLYNLANVNISERIRELATIKVLGFYDKEVYKYISRETVILTIIGILIGCLGGYFLNMFLIETCELSMTFFKKTVEWQSYIYGALITIMFTIIVNIVTYFTLKKINMISSLKSIE